MKSVSIVGSGWLGLAIAKEFLLKNVLVKSSTSTKEKLETLKADGVLPYFLSLDKQHIVSDSAFFDSDLLVITLPTSAKIPLEDQRERLRFLIKNTQSKKIIYTSSTSVYGSNQQSVSEETLAIPDSASGKIQLELEDDLLRLCQQKNLNLAIIRSGGQFGPNRHPGKFLAGKKNLANSDAPVNMIHQYDLVKIIVELYLQNKIIDLEIYNAVANTHPTRKDFYTYATAQLGLEVPTFSSEINQTQGKIVNGEKILKKLSLQLKHDNLFSL